MDDRFNSTYRTRHSLIERIKCSDNDYLWQEFVENYRPFIYYILHKMGVASSEQDDIFQEVLLKLFKSLKTYSKKGKFRSWLGTVIRSAAINHLQMNKKEINEELLLSLQEIYQYKNSELEEIILKEWQEFVFHKAMEKLNKIFERNIINCFRMTLEDVPIEQIERRLGIKRESIYVLRSRLKKRLVTEMKKITQELEF